MNIIVRMMGGIGNQLFQFAYAYKLKSQFSGSRILFDIRGYKKYKAREFELDKLIDKGNFQIINSNSLNYLWYDLTREIYHVFLVIFTKIFHIEVSKTFNWLSKIGLLYTRNKTTSVRITRRKNYYLYGYFQDMRCIDSIRDEFVGSFVFDAFLTEKISPYQTYIEHIENVIVISVRCGDDYIKGNWPICSKQYYKDAIELIKKKYGCRKALVFSDEINRAKNEYIEEPNSFFVEDLSPIEQLYLMKQCKYFIISNSSFCWWGAYLSSIQNKIIIAPKFWYPNEKTEDTGLVYNNMIILNN